MQNYTNYIQEKSQHWSLHRHIFFMQVNDNAPKYSAAIRFIESNTLYIATKPNTHKKN